MKIKMIVKSEIDDNDVVDMGDGDDEMNSEDTLTEGENNNQEDNIQVDDQSSDSSFQCGQPQFPKRSYSKMAGEHVDETDKKKKDSKS